MGRLGFIFFTVLMAQGVWAASGFMDEEEIAKPKVPVTQFKCQNDKRTDQAVDIEKLFKDVLKIEGVEAGNSLVESAGFSGSRVILKIKPGKDFQLTVFHGDDNKGDMPASACWTEAGSGKNKVRKILIFVDASKLGHGKYVVTVTNVGSSTNQIYMSASGELNALINFGYSVEESKGAR